MDFTKPVLESMENRISGQDEKKDGEMDFDLKSLNSSNDNIDNDENVDPGLSGFSNLFRDTSVSTVMDSLSKKLCNLEIGTPFCEKMNKRKFVINPFQRNNPSSVCHNSNKFEMNLENSMKNTLENIDISGIEKIYEDDINAQYDWNKSSSSISYEFNNTSNQMLDSNVDIVGSVTPVCVIDENINNVICNRYSENKRKCFITLQLKTEPNKKLEMNSDNCFTVDTLEGHGSGEIDFNNENTGATNDNFFHNDFHCDPLQNEVPNQTHPDNSKSEFKIIDHSVCNTVVNNSETDTDPATSLEILNISMNEKVYNTQNMSFEDSKTANNKLDVVENINHICAVENIISSMDNNNYITNEHDRSKLTPKEMLHNQPEIMAEVIQSNEFVEESDLVALEKGLTDANCLGIICDDVGATRPETKNVLVDEKTVGSVNSNISGPIQSSISVISDVDDQFGSDILNTADYYISSKGSEAEYDLKSSQLTDEQAEFIDKNNPTYGGEIKTFENITAEVMFDKVVNDVPNKLNIGNGLALNSRQIISEPANFIGEKNLFNDIFGIELGADKNISHDQIIDDQMNEFNDNILMEEHCSFVKLKDGFCLQSNQMTNHQLAVGNNLDNDAVFASEIVGLASNDETNGTEEFIYKNSSTDDLIIESGFNAIEHVSSEVVNEQVASDISDEVNDYILQKNSSAIKLKTELNWEINQEPNKEAELIDKNHRISGCVIERESGVPENVTSEVVLKKIVNDTLNQLDDYILQPNCDDAKLNNKFDSISSHVPDEEIKCINEKNSSVDRVIENVVVDICDEDSNNLLNGQIICDNTPLESELDLKLNSLTNGQIDCNDENSSPDKFHENEFSLPECVRSEVVCERVDIRMSDEVNDSQKNCSVTEQEIGLTSEANKVRNEDLEFADKNNLTSYGVVEREIGILENITSEVVLKKIVNDTLNQLDDYILQPNCDDAKLNNNFDSILSYVPDEEIKCINETNSSVDQVIENVVVDICNEDSNNLLNGQIICDNTPLESEFDLKLNSLTNEQIDCNDENNSPDKFNENEFSLLECVRSEVVCERVDIRMSDEVNDSQKNCSVTEQEIGLTSEANKVRNEDLEFADKNNLTSYGVVEREIGILENITSEVVLKKIVNDTLNQLDDYILQPNCDDAKLNNNFDSILSYVPDEEIKCINETNSSVDQVIENVVVDICNEDSNNLLNGQIICDNTPLESEFDLKLNSLTNEQIDCNDENNSPDKFNENEFSLLECVRSEVVCERVDIRMSDEVNDSQKNCSVTEQEIGLTSEANKVRNEDLEFADKNNLTSYGVVEREIGILENITSELVCEKIVGDTLNQIGKLEYEIDLKSKEAAEIECKEILSDKTILENHEITSDTNDVYIQRGDSFEIAEILHEKFDETSLNRTAISKVAVLQIEDTNEVETISETAYLLSRKSESYINCNTDDINGTEKETKKNFIDLSENENHLFTCNTQKSSSEDNLIDFKKETSMMSLIKSGQIENLMLNSPHHTPNLLDMSINKLDAYDNFTYKRENTPYCLKSNQLSKSEKLLDISISGQSTPFANKLSCNNINKNLECVNENEEGTSSSHLNRISSDSNEVILNSKTDTFENNQLALLEKNEQFTHPVVQPNTVYNLQDQEKLLDQEESLRFLKMQLQEKDNELQILSTKQEEMGVLIKDQSERNTELELLLEDLYKKYEKGKEVNVALKENEIGMKKMIEDYKVIVDNLETKYNILKNYATIQLSKANVEIDRIIDHNNQQEAKFKTQINQMDVEIQSFRELNQKLMTENANLKGMYNDFANKFRSGSD